MARSSGTRRSSYSSVSSSTRRSYNGGRSRKKRNDNPAPLIAGGILVLILAVILAVITQFKGKDLHGGVGGSDPETTALVENISKEEIEHNAVIDLSAVTGKDTFLQVQGMKPSEISKAIQETYDWDLVILNEDAETGNVIKPTVDANQTTEAATMGDAENPDQLAEGETQVDHAQEEITVTDRIEIQDYIAARIPALIEEIVDAEEAYKESIAEETTTEAETQKKKLFAKETTEETSETEAVTEAPVVYVLSLDGMEEELSQIASYAEQMWYVEPRGGSIGSYDADNDKFIMEGAKNGFKLDEDALRSELLDTVRNHKYTASIRVTGEVLSGEARTNADEYRTLASFTTNTTSNSIRNKNIQLAARKLNGTIVRPGEEFSFNNTIGERTEAKGYGAAAAYNNGEVVQEIGGGVCQVSSTLYNAVVKAGLKVTYRQGHTFQPTYVTPGQDATVSWGGPDFRFANLPAIPTYSNDNQYAIGIRASYYNQQVTVSIYGRPVLKSGYTYSMSSEKTSEKEIVRKLIEPGSDKTPTTGTKGSVWETKLIIKNGDQVVSNSRDHTTIYTGHIEYYTDQTSPEETSPAESESIIDGEINDEPQVPQGPGTPQGPGAPQGPGGPGTPAGPGPGPTQATEPEVTSGESSDGPGGAPSGDSSSPAPGSLSGDSSVDDEPGYISIGGGVVIEGGPGSVSIDDGAGPAGPGGPG